MIAEDRGRVVTDVKVDAGLSGVLELLQSRRLNQRRLLLRPELAWTKGKAMLWGQGGAGPAGIRRKVRQTVPSICTSKIE